MSIIIQKFMSVSWQKSRNIYLVLQSTVVLYHMSGFHLVARIQNHITCTYCKHYCTTAGIKQEIRNTSGNPIHDNSGKILFDLECLLLVATFKAFQAYECTSNSTSVFCLTWLVKFFSYFSQNVLTFYVNAFLLTKLPQ